MKDVSCRAIRKLTKKAEALGFDTDALLSNLGFDRETLLNGFNHIDWATFNTFTGKLERMVGGEQAMMELCTVRTPEPIGPRLAALLGWLVSPRMVYRFLGSILLPLNYPCVETTYRIIGDGHMEFQMRCPGGDCLPTLHLGVGCLRIAPRWIGSADAEVESKFDNCEAVYTVKLPPNRTFSARIARSISILFSGRNAMRILSAQAMELKKDYFHLEHVQQQLEGRVATATHEEQKRIAAELQAEVGGKLRRISQSFHSLRNRLSHISPDGMREAGEICNQLREAILMTKNLANGLDPISLHAGSLKQALNHLAIQTRTHCGVACEFHDIGSSFQFDHASSVHLYRLSQEAINNAIKHGMARHIQILLASADDVVSLTITDDGNGIKEVSGHHEGRGAKIMQYRAKMVGGELRLESEPGRSTSVSCMVKRPRNSNSTFSTFIDRFLPPGGAVASRNLDS